MVYKFIWEGDAMGKARDTQKGAKKKPLLTLKEKRKKKKEKGEHQY
jgi:hypothetical protein